MVLDIGSSQWAKALCDKTNELPLLREICNGLSATFGLAFDGGDDERPTRHLLVRIEAGLVTSSDVVDAEVFESADVRLAGTYLAWRSLLDGEIEPVRAILLRRLRWEGDKLMLLRGLPSAKALIEAASALGTAEDAA